MNNGLNADSYLTIEGGTWRILVPDGLTARFLIERPDGTKEEINVPVTPDVCSKHEDARGVSVPGVNLIRIRRNMRGPVRSYKALYF